MVNPSIQISVSENDGHKHATPLNIHVSEASPAEVKH